MTLLESENKFCIDLLKVTVTTWAIETSNQAAFSVKKFHTQNCKMKLVIGMSHKCEIILSKTAEKTKLS